MSYVTESNETVVFLQSVLRDDGERAGVLAMSPRDTIPQKLAEPPEADRYYIIAIDANCQLIVSLYDKLMSRETPAKIFAGSRLLPWPLDTQAPLASGLWHQVTETTRECYCFRAKCKAATAEEFLSLPGPFELQMLMPFLRFAGFEPNCFELVALRNVLCEIGDPRWFLEAWRFRERDPVVQLSRYFGLFLSKRSISESAKRRQALLLDLWAGLPEQAWLRQEYVVRKWFKLAADAAGILGPRILLDFICRHWLCVLTGQNYFDPTRFFKCEDALKNYDRQQLHPLRRREV